MRPTCDAEAVTRELRNNPWKMAAKIFMASSQPERNPCWLRRKLLQLQKKLFAAQVKRGRPHFEGELAKGGACPQPPLMPLVRVLVDGYSLLHNWPELAPGQTRHSAAAREALVERLTHYRDATGTPITIFFDGSLPRGAGPKTRSSPEVEAPFSAGG